ncbi:hypothetical protein M2360_001088 [Rhizobium sp. SG_E_25_P2]|uniref:SGNH/GDSL hydrolase family protein n=1 Tax=Rhizobium sp. SG_E_25_P2 TaxID=2879942 RepID=UPI002473564B|nr:DUF459 domain-containing protein [Rhizobium sp. SG_E_25_P2]MDH6265698.1 hypothetical protein [Rhizobium sp. SG_E_25_P2]
MADHSHTSSRPSCAKRVIILILALILPLADLAASAAQAQEFRQRRSILDVILGRPQLRQREDARPQRVRPRRNTAAKKRAVQTVKTAPAGPLVKKADARKIVVIGDFMASGLADGLTAAFAQDPTITVVKETDSASGLVRSDHLDWPKTLSQKIDRHKPSLIVIMLGSNDRQQIDLGGATEKFRSEGWDREYQRRVDDLASVAARAKIPFIWAGLPSFQSPSLSADAATLNNIYRTRMEAVGGAFIDIWDGFADESGKYIATGSDINGQPVRLRGSDGVSLTKAGKRKMAFYLEKDIARLLGGDAVSDLVRLDATGLPLDAAPKTEIHEITALPPISLSDPDLDGSAELLDQTLLPQSAGKTPRDRLIEKGETAPAPVGRVDDYRWPANAKPAG